MDDFVLDPNDLSEEGLIVATAACESEFDLDDFVLDPNDLSEGGFNELISLLPGCRTKPHAVSNFVLMAL